MPRPSCRRIEQGHTKSTAQRDLGLIQESIDFPESVRITGKKRCLEAPLFLFSLRLVQPNALHRQYPSSAGLAGLLQRQRTERDHLSLEGALSLSARRFVWRSDGRTAANGRRPQDILQIAQVDGFFQEVVESCRIGLPLVFRSFPSADRDDAQAGERLFLTSGFGKGIARQAARHHEIAEDDFRLKIPGNGDPRPDIFSGSRVVSELCQQELKDRLAASWLSSTTKTLRTGDDPRGQLHEQHRRSFSLANS